MKFGSVKVDKIELEEQAKGLVESEFPRQVILEPINTCNIDCIMCPSSGLTRRRGIMEIGLFKKIINEIALESPETKLWPALMGEPLLAGETLFEMLAYAHKMGIRVFLNTNAVLLDHSAIQRLKEYDVKEVIVGIDALTKNTYEKIRVGGDFNIVCKNIEKMLSAYGDRGPKVVLQYIVMPENEHEAEDFRTLWLKKGAIIKMRIKQGWGDLVGSEYLTLNQNERLKTCPWLSRNIEILWDGEVCQCDGDMDNEYSCGNINKQTIKEIWQGEMRKRRQRHYMGDFDFKPCNTCNDWQVGLSKFYYPDDPENPRIVDERA